jgi:hypothetical protein
MKKENRDDYVERRGSDLRGLERSFDEVEISNVRGVEPGLLDRRGREIEADEFADMRSQQQFGVADAAAETQYARSLAGSREFQNPANHVLAQGPDRGLGEMRLREAGVKFLVILNFALEVGGQGLNTVSRKDAKDAKKALWPYPRSSAAYFVFSLIANTLCSPRIKIIPSEIAGVAISTSPTGFVESNSYLSPAFTTNTSPSSLGK